jgi:hypothetical protein
MDTLVLEHFVLDKVDQKRRDEDTDWRNECELD